MLSEDPEKIAVTAALLQPHLRQIKPTYRQLRDAESSHHPRENTP
jgi:hypothetical protein